MNKENCALKLVDEIILYYDARSKKHQIDILSILGGKSVEKIQLPLTFDNNNVYFM